MIKDVATRFDKRQGGYTKTVRLGKRFGDDSTMVLIEWSEAPKAVLAEEPKKTKPAKVNPETKAKKPVRKAPVQKTKKETKKK